MFGQIARRYDFLNHLLSLGIDHYWRWRTVRLVPPSGSLPILDVCTGTGDLAFAYDRAAGRKTPIVGGDFCHEMLAIARQKATRAARRLSYHVHRSRCPGFASSQRCVSNRVRRLRPAQRGRHRPRPGRDDASLRPRRPRRRARILDAHLAAIQSHLRLVLSQCPAAHRKNLRARFGRCYEYLPTSVGEFPQGEALADRMRAAGLTEVRRYPLTLGVATLYVGKKASAISRCQSKVDE